MLHWLRGYVFTHEEHFAFYKRSHLRHYYIRDNCRHEGTNNGIKYGAAPVGPTYSLLRSSIILSLQLERRNENLDILHTK